METTIPTSLLTRLASALEACRLDLFIKVESKHDSKFASEYPEVALAAQVLADVKPYLPGSQDTPEVRAVKQFLSKPEPISSGCGCMGAQIIDSESNARARMAPWGSKTYEYTMKVDFVPEHKVTVARCLRRLFKLSMADLQPILAAQTYTKVLPFHPEELDEFDLLMKCAVVTITSEAPKRYPVCPCCMKWVEEVDGNFYRILVDRSPEHGVRHSAVLMGPVGGPYVNVW